MDNSARILFGSFGFPFLHASCPSRGARFAALVNHLEWSHDSQHVCLATMDGPFIARFDATDGGSRIALPPDGDTLVADTCAWSHDDSAVVWHFGPRLYVAPAAGGSPTEIARASATVDRLQLGPWSPTEQRRARYVADRTVADGALRALRTVPDSCAVPAAVLPVASVALGQRTLR